MTLSEEKIVLTEKIFTGIVLNFDKLNKLVIVISVSHFLQSESGESVKFILNPT